MIVDLDDLRAEYIEALGEIIAAAVWMERGGDPSMTAHRLRDFWESKLGLVGGEDAASGLPADVERLQQELARYKRGWSGDELHDEIERLRVENARLLAEVNMRRLAQKALHSDG